MDEQTIRYFAYGMNLDPDNMAYFGARKVDRARLHDWKLVFHGFADIEPSPGDYVEGGVWEFPVDQLAAMDRREGIFPEWADARNMYERIQVKADMPWDEVECLTYRMLPETAKMLEYAPPLPHYLEWIKNGRRFFGIEETEDLPCLPA